MTVTRPSADHACGISSNARISGPQQLGEQGGTRSLVGFINGKRQQTAIVVTLLFRQPFIERGDDFLRVVFNEQALGLIPSPAFLGVELFEQLRHACTCELGGRDFVATLPGDAPYAAVFLVAVGMPVAGLVMTDDGVIPI